MFKCANCNQVDSFSLMLSEDYAGPGVFTQEENEHGEIIINIDGYEFIPDLAFMNTHAVCKFCGQINQFEYYFEKVEEEREKEKSKAKSPEKPNVKNKTNPKPKKPQINVDKRK